MGAHTYNQWSLLLDRWVEKPPPDYLQSTPIWVQMRNIPVNHHTKEAIKIFAEFAGPVIQVEYDPSISQNKDFVRAEILFDVSKSLRRSKVINLPSGEPITILYDYERIQKRCYFCQRLTHEREKCPLYLQKQKDLQKKDKNNFVHDRSTVLSSFSYPVMNFQEEPVMVSPIEKTAIPVQPTMEAESKGNLLEPLHQSYPEDEDTIFSENPSSPSSSYMVLTHLPEPEKLYEVPLASSYVFDILNSEAGTSESSKANSNCKNKSLKPARNKRGTTMSPPLLNSESSLDSGTLWLGKRKSSFEGKTIHKVAKSTNLKMVPNKGPSNI
ncbi:PREDICTED: uncharacterized protein At4g02000-like [Camelina sativa]|uniref:Uncharacterized protein At4g02000-like n=1 Tax=Camelina sativa TaxID=90675 RepID=A0ABM0V639_CAMSA|nr:PREDICTED: uncharacterized protein At4g02000-like [Camelina sativa]